MDFKDYYSTLGVSKTATEKELKQAFRKLARKHHPDVNPGDKSAESRFKEINEAYEVLGDPAKRKKYDELGANWRAYENAGPGAPGGPGFGWNANTGGQPGGGGYRTMTEEEMRRGASVFRLLPDVFRRRRWFRRRRPRGGGPWRTRPPRQRRT